MASSVWQAHTVRAQELAMVFTVTCKEHPTSIVAPRYLKHWVLPRVCRLCNAGLSTQRVGYSSLSYMLYKLIFYRRSASLDSFRRLRCWRSQGKPPQSAWWVILDRTSFGIFRPALKSILRPLKLEIDLLPQQQIARQVENKNDASFNCKIYLVCRN